MGAKWRLDDPSPAGPIDCSGFVRWVLAPWVLIPDGSYHQVGVCKKLPAAVKAAPLDLGFADLSGGDGVVDHVVMVLNGEEVIEARAKPYSAVIKRPRERWLAQKGFLGFYTVPGIYV